ncbi:MAG TPA: LamG domain-containing protein [Gemmataceae bacterium]
MPFRHLSAFICAVAFAVSAVRADDLTLAPGRFGLALDARKSPAVVDSNERFRRPPVTVECWAKLDGKDGVNILIASDPAASPRHWRLFAAAGTGHLSAGLTGFEPSEVVSATDICDSRWHYLAMTWDGTTVRLFADGKLAAERAVKSRGLRVAADPKKHDGPLTIGMAVTDAGLVGCTGLIDDVRISDVVRTIDRAPAAELPLDPRTIGLWRFDGPAEPSADPAWTPRPAAGNAASWEKETDADWQDNRFRRMDTGPSLNATFTYPSWSGKVYAYKGTAVRVGGGAAVLFDRARLRLAAGWDGGWLNLSDRRFGLLNTPTPAGRVAFATGSGPGWAGPDGRWDAPTPSTAPLPRDWAHYQGLYRHGDRTVFSYTVGGAAVLDAPWAEPGDGGTVFTRTVEVGPADRPLAMLAGELPATASAQHAAGDTLVYTVVRDGICSAVGLVSGAGARLESSAGGRVAVHVAPSRGRRRFTVLAWQGPETDLPTFLRRAAALPPPADLAAWTKPGPARWTAPVVTRGEVAPDDAAFVADTLTVPYENPYHALMFLSGLDVLPNGDLAVCTAHGDVWIVSSVNDRLERVTWKRFATGLFQPLGLKVVGGKVVVLERGQLTRLHDTNGDGEADFFENVNNDWHTGAGEHSYDTCLETDPAGNFYLFKTGDTNLPTGGCLIRVSADGKSSEVFCTGFRHPIGLSVGPDGTVTGADQEGNWMPATRIDVYRRGGFYGDMRAHHRSTAPVIYDPPLCWLPREADNSAGGQVWVPPEHWGPLGGQLLHLSYGRCRLYLLLRQTIGGVQQAGAADLGLSFESGVMRGRFHPGDGHLYVCGLRGWQTAARKDGCLQRVRYTGKPVTVPVGLAAHADGLRLTFAVPLDRAAAADAGRYKVERWNYRWSGDYGSKKWSVVDPNKEGADAVGVDAAEVAADGRSVFLRLAGGVRPVMQMQVDYRLRTADDKPLRGTVYNTVHATTP